MIFPQPHEVMTTTSMTPLPYALSEEPQARWVDISFWYRTGGIDWSRLRNTVDGVIIRAGQGYYGYDALLTEHVDKAVAAGVPYHTYWQLDRRQNIDSQMLTWITGHGVAGHKKMLAIEYCGGQLATASECLKAFALLEDNTDDDVYGYSRVRLLLQDLGDPEWVKDYRWLIAQYPYVPYTSNQYTRFEEYLTDHEYELPADIEKFGAYHIDVVAQQFTSKLDAQFYFANAKTEDPNYSVGMKSGDGIVSMEPYTKAMEWFLGELIPPPPDPPPEDPALVERVTELEKGFILVSEILKDHEDRITALEKVEPAPDTLTATAADNFSAYHIYDYNKVPLPMMKIYELDGFGSRVRKEMGDKFQVYPEPVDTDGSIDYYKMVEKHSDGTELYCPENQVYI